MESILQSPKPFVLEWDSKGIKPEGGEKMDQQDKK